MARTLAQAAGVERIVHCSSVAALGVTDDGTPADETTPTNEADSHLDVSLWFVLRVARKAQLNPDPREFKDVRWFHLDELPTAISKGQRHLLHIALAQALLPTLFVMHCVARPRKTVG